MSDSPEENTQRHASLYQPMSPVGRCQLSARLSCGVTGLDPLHPVLIPSPLHASHGWFGQAPELPLLNSDAAPWAAPPRHPMPPRWRPCLRKQPRQYHSRTHGCDSTTAPAFRQAEFRPKTPESPDSMEPPAFRSCGFVQFVSTMDAAPKEKRPGVKSHIRPRGNQDAELTNGVRCHWSPPVPSRRC